MRVRSDVEFGASGWLRQQPRSALLALLWLALTACQPPGYNTSHTHMVDAATVHDASPVTPPDATPDASGPVCAHAFLLEGHGDAASVWISGDFVHWAVDPAHGAIVMTLDGAGNWHGSYAFTAGTYAYKYVINGTTWIADPTDPNTEPDGNGGSNSLYTCVP
jgi:hypothetical protein